MPDTPSSTPDRLDASDRHLQHVFASYDREVTALFQEINSDPSLSSQPNFFLTINHFTAHELQFQFTFLVEQMSSVWRTATPREKILISEHMIRLSPYLQFPQCRDYRYLQSFLQVLWSAIDTRLAL